MEKAILLKKRRCAKSDVVGKVTSLEKRHIGKSDVLGKATA
jgi:hypothetical protein